MSDQLASPPKKRSRGAQPGNFNALKHGFYSRQSSALASIPRPGSPTSTVDLNDEIACCASSCAVSLSYAERHRRPRRSLATLKSHQHRLMPASPPCFVSRRSSSANPKPRSISEALTQIVQDLHLDRRNMTQERAPPTRHDSSCTRARISPPPSSPLAGAADCRHSSVSCATPGELAAAVQLSSRQKRRPLRRACWLHGRADCPFWSQFDAQIRRLAIRKSSAEIGQVYDPPSATPFDPQSALIAEQLRHSIDLLRAEIDQLASPSDTPPSSPSNASPPSKPPCRTTNPASVSSPMALPSSKSGLGWPLAVPACSPSSPSSVRWSGPVMPSSRRWF